MRTRTISARQSTTTVLPGLDVFLANLPRALRGKRVGLITNHSAIDRAGVSAIDRIAAHKRLTLVALLAPEHGIRGTAAEGVKVGDEVDAKTGVPVYSLYMAEDRGPTPEMLKNVDVLVYDLQEVGGRTWTYVSTMALSMKAAARRGIPFVVLDRPNPIGGEIVEGALIAPGFTSFVGMYPIPARHGLTVGELAAYFNHAFGIGADLIVARASSWQRGQWMDDTGLPWVNPSPNLRSLAALSSYPGTVYFEGTNLTEGRGTDRPFEQIGAPWLDAQAVAATMNGLYLQGVRFEPVVMQVLADRVEVQGREHPRAARRGHQSADLSSRAYGLDPDRRDQASAPGAVPLGPVDRSAHGFGQGQARHRRRPTRAAARGLGPRGRRLQAHHRAIPALPLTTSCTAETPDAPRSESGPTVPHSEAGRGASSQRAAP